MGACLLQPWTTDLALLGFRDTEHLLTYRTTDEAMDKVKHYLSRPEERKAIGERARQAILAGHTYIHRAVKIAETTTRWKQPPQASIAEWVNTPWMGMA